MYLNPGLLAGSLADASLGKDEAPNLAEAMKPNRFLFPDQDAGLDGVAFLYDTGADSGPSPQCVGILGGQTKARKSFDVAKAILRYVNKYICAGGVC